MSGRAPPSFAQLIVAWQRSHGRHHLPWQNTRDPYRVWLSEVMLQQTQVQTVLGYYARFLEQFPTVADLARAPLDQVFGLWSGLGYYSRARNLHRCAVDVVSLHGGEFPNNAEGLQALPGIGRSTAAAIASICYGERVAILDGNVRRVVSRYLGFSSDLSLAKNEQTLWAKASELLPKEPAVMSIFTQGVMDLGASLCARRRPQCESCPLVAQCVAHLHRKEEDFPVRTRKIKRSTQSWWLLCLLNSSGSVYLVKRADKGVWAGLYCFPVADSELSALQILPQHWSQSAEVQAAFTHILTHLDLVLHVVVAHAVDPMPITHLLPAQGQWFTPSEWSTLGMPAPVRKWLESHLLG